MTVLPFGSNPVLDTKKNKKLERLHFGSLLCKMDWCPKSVHRNRGSMTWWSFVGEKNETEENQKSEISVERERESLDRVPGSRLAECWTEK